MVALLARLTIAHKLLISVLMLALPVVALLYVVVSRYNVEIRAATRELESARRLEPLRRANEDVRLHQRLQVLLEKQVADLGWKRTATLASGIFALVLAGLVGLVTARNITVPLKEVVDLASDVAAGQTEEARRRLRGRAIARLLASRHPRDEICQLLAAVAHMTDSLDSLLEERKRAEDALRRSERQLQLILDGGPTLISYVDAGFRYRWVNRSYESRFCQAREQIRGRHVREVQGDAAWEVLRPYGQRALEGRTVLYEGQLAPPGAAAGWVRATCTPDFDESGKVLGFVVHATEISDVKRGEAATRFLASSVESSAHAIVSLDLNGRVTSWNRGAERILGYTAGEMVGRPISTIVPSDAVPSPNLRECIERGERVEQHETTRRTKGGALLHVSIMWSPIYDAAGRVVGASEIIRDISERRQAEAQRRRVEEQRLELLAKERALAAERTLRETEAELARALRALSVSELAASIGHEVNQPLAGVVTNAEAGLRWLDGLPPNLDEVRASLGLIVRDANRASEVIRRIRQFLKKEQAQRESLDINEVIDEALTLAHGALQKHAVAVRVQLSPGLPPVPGDRIQLQQVVLNLALNGCEAMTSTQARELLVTSRTSPDGHVLVAVSDCGAGIAAEDLPRMFDALFTTKPRGMGMGLSVSKSIVEAHGGRIWAAANDGPGLTVQFSLPIRAAEGVSASHVLS